jgi:WD40 repeat protein
MESKFLGKVGHQLLQHYLECKSAVVVISFLNKCFTFSFDLPYFNTVGIQISCNSGFIVSVSYSYDLPYLILFTIDVVYCTNVLFFAGHTAKVFHIKWSPLREGMLASGSDDW